MSNFIRPYRTGDVVLIDGEEHVIQEVQIDGLNDYQYATHRSAWHDHQDLIFVRECDEQSMELLLNSINGEIDEDQYEEIEGDEEEEKL